MIEVPARPHFRQVGDRCRDFVIALTPHPITCVRKCRAAILNLKHVLLVVLGTLTSTRMRHSRNQVVENQNSQLGPHRLGEGGDDHKERWFGKARTIGAKLKSQSRVVLNPHFQIETIDGRPPQRHPRGQLQGSQRLRGKLRDGAGNLSQACRTSSSDHGNLRSHARATQHSQLTFSWCRTRDNLSSHCCPARPAW